MTAPHVFCEICCTHGPEHTHILLPLGATAQPTPAQAQPQPREAHIVIEGTTHK